MKKSLFWVVVAAVLFSAVEANACHGKAARRAARAAAYGGECGAQAVTTTVYTSYGAGCQGGYGGCAGSQGGCAGGQGGYGGYYPMQPQVNPLPQVTPGVPAGPAKPTQLPAQPMVYYGQPVYWMTSYGR